MISRVRLGRRKPEMQELDRGQSTGRRVVKRPGKETKQRKALVNGDFKEEEKAKSEKAKCGLVRAWLGGRIRQDVRHPRFQ